MERNIGEIFEYEGEWYQRVKNIKGDSCIGCSFYKKGMVCCKCPIECEGVIFKELEPVGDPYPLYDHIVQRYAGVKFPVALTEKRFINCNEINNTVDIEVKQDKENTEDMETNEKTMPIPDGWEFDRIDESGNIVLKEKKKELPKTWKECFNSLKEIEYITEEAEVIYIWTYYHKLMTKAVVFFLVASASPCSPSASSSSAATHGGRCSTGNPTILVMASTCPKHIAEMG